MNWRRLCEIGQTLRGVATNDATITVRGEVVARRIDADTVAFAVATDEERDAVIACAPERYFTTARYAELPVVLAKLATLDDGEAHARLGAPDPAAAVQPRPAPKLGPRLYYLGYATEDDKPERRKFKRLGRNTVERWLLAAWRSHLAEESWGAGIPHQDGHLIEHAFNRADEEDITCPADDDAALEALREVLHCASDFFHTGDDFEGRQWEFYLFDERYLRGDDSDYLPHPERGETRKNCDDGYRELLAKHGKHQRA